MNRFHGHRMTNNVIPRTYGSARPLSSRSTAPKSGPFIGPDQQHSASPARRLHQHPTNTSAITAFGGMRTFGQVSRIFADSEKAARPPLKASLSFFVVPKCLFQPLNRVTPFRGLGSAGRVLVSKKPDLIDRLIERDRLSPLDGHKILHFVGIIYELPMIGRGGEHIECRPLATVICRDLEVRRPFWWTFDPSNSNETLAWRFDPNAIACLEEVERVRIPGTPPVPFSCGFGNARRGSREVKRSGTQRDPRATVQGGVFFPNRANSSGATNRPL